MDYTGFESRVIHGDSNRAIAPLVIPPTYLLTAFKGSPPLIGF